MTQTETMRPPREFLELSAKIGSDPLQVQGAGGNTSVKDEESMWVKASGTWLKDATSSEIFVRLPVQEVVEALGSQEEPNLSGLVTDGELRPSIETTFHALLPQRVVLHTHSIATIAHSISDQGIGLLDKKLNGLKWRLVPYAKPGAALTRAMAGMIAGEEPLVLILANHGLIVAASDTVEAESLLREVEDRLTLDCLGNGTVLPSTRFPGWKWMDGRSFLATDPLALERAAQGTYYPDHIVFLGSGMPVLYGIESQDEITRLGKLGEQGRPAVLVRGVGVLVKEGAKPAVEAMVGCLNDVLSRIPQDWSLNSLTVDQEAVLLDWDAEKYRQELEKNR